MAMRCCPTKKQKCTDPTTSAATTTTQDSPVVAKVRNETCWVGLAAGNSDQRFSVAIQHLCLHLSSTPASKISRSVFRAPLLVIWNFEAAYTSAQ